MRRILLLSVILSIGCFMSAAYLSPEEALARYGNSRHMSRANGDDLQLLYTGSSGVITGYYVFGSNDGDGYVVLSADDCAAPLLGYSDEGRFSIENMPPALKSWLDSYIRHIEWGVATGASAYRMAAGSRAGHAAVRPLLESKWDQGTPYNDECPVVRNKNGVNSRAVTGCVATAMAQVMYYHKWPATGRGSNSYTFISNGQQYQQSMNFAEVTFDWDQMTPVYDASSSRESKSAVAALMHAAGVSVDMSYTPEESGADGYQIGVSMVKYFDYNPNIRLAIRNYYDDASWKDMVLAELDSHRPVIYGGYGSLGGHSFVCDGYDGNGYFHFNWGWSGSSDGYFLLDALNPPALGIGGGGGGFNFDQDMVIGIAPSTESVSVEGASVLAQSGFSAGASEYARANGINITFYPNTEWSISNDLFWNVEREKIVVEFGVELVNRTTNASSHIGTGANYSMPFSSGYKSYSIAAMKMPVGEWDLYPAVYNTATGTWSRISVPVWAQGYLPVTVTENRITIDRGAMIEGPDIAMTNLTSNGDLVANGMYEVTCDFTNSGMDSREALQLVFTSKESGKRYSTGYFPLYLAKGQTVEGYRFDGTLPDGMPTGTYNMAVMCGQFYNANVKLGEITVNVVEGGYMVLLDFRAVTDAQGKMPKNDMEFELKVKAEGGPVCNNVDVVIFPGTGGYALTQLTSSQPVRLEKDGTSPFRVKGAYDAGVVGESYFALAYCNQDELKNVAGDRVFADFVLDVPATTAIDIPGAEDEVLLTPNPAVDIVTVVAPAEVATAEVFSMTGAMVARVCGDAAIDVSALPGGHYVVRIVLADGTTVVRRLVKM